MRLYHHTSPTNAQTIRQHGFRDTHYVVEDKQGVWLCTHIVHHQPGDVLVVVEVPEAILSPVWATYCARDPWGAHDWVIPAAVLNSQGTLI